MVAGRLSGGGCSVLLTGGGMRDRVLGVALVMVCDGGNGDDNGSVW